jgi:DNA end-binding protein Ku
MPARRQPEPEEDEAPIEMLESQNSRRQPVPEPVLEPVRQVSVRKESDQVLSEKSVVKGYEYEKDRYVVIEPEELKSIAPKTATEMQIEEFVNLAEVDPVYFETSYYVVPEEAGQKAYALLYKSLQQTELVAVAQFAMHSREHVVIVRPGGKGLVAHTMFFSSEVRADEEYLADTGTLTAKELGLAQTLIHSLAAPFAPEKYRDTYREKLEAIIAKRVAGQPAAVPEMPSRSTSVVDITEALQKSLAALKKPAASEETRNTPKTSGTQKKKVVHKAG